MFITSMQVTILQSTGATLMTTWHSHLVLKLMLMMLVVLLTRMPRTVRRNSSNSNGMSLWPRCKPPEPNTRPPTSNVPWPQRERLALFPSTVTTSHRAGASTVMTLPCRRQLPSHPTALRSSPTSPTVSWTSPMPTVTSCTVWPARSLSVWRSAVVAMSTSVTVAVGPSGCLMRTVVTWLSGILSRLASDGLPALLHCATDNWQSLTANDARSVYAPTFYKLVSDAVQHGTVDVSLYNLSGRSAKQKEASGLAV